MKVLKRLNVIDNGRVHFVARNESVDKKNYTINVRATKTNLIDAVLQGLQCWNVSEKELRQFSKRTLLKIAHNQKLLYKN